MKKKLLLLVILLAIVAGVYFYLFYKQENKSETVGNNGNSSLDATNWNVYRNTKYNYEVSYLADWKGAEAESDASFAVIYKDKGDMGSLYVAVKVFENIEQETPQDWWKEQDKKDDAQYEFLGTLSINGGITGYHYREINGLLSHHVIFSKDREIFELSSPLMQQKFLQFVNSFKFLK